MGRRNINQRNTKKEKKFTTRMQSTLLLLFCGIIVLLTILIVVLAKINYSDGERYSKKVLNQQTYVSSSIPYKRGDIVDRNGTVLATSVKVYNLIIDVKKLLQYQDYIDTTLVAVSEYFDISMDELNQIMIDKAESSYVVLRKQIDSDLYDEFDEFMSNKENKVKGIWFEEEYKRVYPNNSLASSLIGFTVSGDVGTYGIEETYNDELVGTNGLSYGYFDSNLELVRVNKEAKNGNTIVTTIDASVQRIVEQKINEFLEEYPTKVVSVLVMNPNNGDIYAMSTNTQYDLNNPRDLTPYYSDEEIEAMDSEEKLNALYDIWRNTIISNNFEPGSTFKPFTIAAALEEDVISYDEEFLCDGYENVQGTKIRCNKKEGHGHITLTEAIMLSCNDALMSIGSQEGRSIFYHYQTSFLFGSKTNIDLPGEGTGIIKSEDSISAVDLASSSFGQTSEVTMIQLAAAFSSLVNGGYYYEPHVMKQIESDQGSIIERNDGVLVKQTVSSETSDFLKNALYLTVEEGTAQGAKTEGYAVGGKTGTAQKFPRSDDTFILSFIGAVPIDDPEVVIYVTLDEVQDKNHYKDSKLATKFASSILPEILPFLDVYPSGDIDYSVWGFDTTKEETDEATQGDGESTDTSEEDDPYAGIVNDPLSDELDADVLEDDVIPATDPSDSTDDEGATAGTQASDDGESTDGAQSTDDGESTGGADSQQGNSDTGGEQ